MTAERLEELRNRYQQLCHAMQTGVAFDLEHDPSSGTPKHLRVGVNAAMSDHGALVALLIAKNLITEAEYFEYLVEFMEREVKSYQETLRARMGGIKITLL